MSISREELECGEAFARRDYQQCAKMSRVLCETTGISPDLLRAYIISLQRMGSALLRGLLPTILRRTEDDPWEHALLQAVLGKPSEARALAKSAYEKCQLYFCEGAGLETQGDVVGAEAKFEACVRTDETCPEAYFAQEHGRALKTRARRRNPTSSLRLADSSPGPPGTPASNKRSGESPYSVVVHEIGGEATRDQLQGFERSVSHLSRPEKVALVRSRVARHLAAARKEGDRQREASLLLNLGSALDDIGLYPEAREALSRAVELSRVEGNRYIEVGALQCLAAVATNDGSFEEALELCKTCRELSRSVGYLKGEADSLGQTAMIRVRQGRREDAITKLRRARELFEEIGDHENAGFCVAQLQRLGVEP